MTCKSVKKKTKIGLEPSSTATNQSIGPWVYTQLISQTLQRKQQTKHQTSQGKGKIRWRWHLLEWDERNVRKNTKF